MTTMRPLATALLLLAAPLLGIAQSIGGLTARATASSIALRPTSLRGAALEDLQFSYSRDAGATWEPIEASCVEFDSGEAIWHVLECLQTDVFEGANIQFKARINICEPVDYDGYTYRVIEIGSQCWFAENLRTTHYANGDAISGNLTNKEWQGAESGAQAVYSSRVANLTIYGRLYNWHAVSDTRGLCPSKWHVPTDGEYTDLTDFLGGESVAGAEMKNLSMYSPTWRGLKNSKFSALPGGGRYANGDFGNIGSYAYFWSSSPNGSSAWNRKLFSGSSNVGIDSSDQRYGFSVRCVRD